MRRAQAEDRPVSSIVRAALKAYLEGDRRAPSPAPHPYDGGNPWDTWTVRVSIRPGQWPDSGIGSGPAIRSDNPHKVERRVRSPLGLPGIRQSSAPPSHVPNPDQPWHQNKRHDNQHRHGHPPYVGAMENQPVCPLSLVVHHSPSNLRRRCSYSKHGSQTYGNYPLTPSLRAVSLHNVEPIRVVEAVQRLCYVVR